MPPVIGKSLLLGLSCLQHIFEFADLNFDSVLLVSVKHDTHTHLAQDLVLVRILEHFVIDGQLSQFAAKFVLFEHGLLALFTCDVHEDAALPSGAELGVMVHHPRVRAEHVNWGAPQVKPAPEPARHSASLA